MNIYIYMDTVQVAPRRHASAAARVCPSKSTMFQIIIGIGTRVWVINFFVFTFFQKLIFKISKVVQ